MMIPIIIAEMYSALPCPNGCSRSAGFKASFVPIMVIMEESASVRLFTASRITAMELERIPATALKEARNIFARIPIMPVLMMITSRLSFILCPEKKIPFIISESEVNIKGNG